MSNLEKSCSNTKLSDRCYDEIESAGEILKVCREAKGLSLDSVSEELKILKRNLSLLENDKAHEELSLLFAKGYLKNYAHFLDLDAKLLESKWQLQVPVDSFDEEAVESEPVALSSDKSDQKTLHSLLGRLFEQSHNQSNHRAYYGVIAVVAIMGGALWLNADPAFKPSAQPNMVTVETPKGITTEFLASEESEQESPSSILSSFQSLSHSVAARIENSSSELTPSIAEMTDAQRADFVAKLRQDYAASLDNIEGKVSKPLAAVVSYSANSLNQQDETILRAGETGISTMLTPESQSELSFFFSDDCWIKVVDGQNRIVYEAVAKQNESLELEGTPPFKVTLGYAPAVQVSYNGEPVEINTRQGRNVARIVLGS